jgi:hypothetical protein
MRICAAPSALCPMRERAPTREPDRIIQAFRKIGAFAMNGRCRHFRRIFRRFELLFLQSRPVKNFAIAP